MVVMLRRLSIAVDGPVMGAKPICPSVAGANQRRLLERVALSSAGLPKEQQQPARLRMAGAPSQQLPTNCVPITTTPSLRNGSLLPRRLTCTPHCCCCCRCRCPLAFIARGVADKQPSSLRVPSNVTRLTDPKGQASPRPLSYLISSTTAATPPPPDLSSPVVSADFFERAIAVALRAPVALPASSLAPDLASSRSPAAAAASLREAPGSCLPRLSTLSSATPYLRPDS
ncbi:uncharacterized protein BDR25DRAFT_79857 [Lindgomyces ingoldianus]|uniref:Uncharacterized protein n=1 Tax=Lindgomyces ingoldianus TaxID=673940 RepID=A0ACB6QGZ7_9PLEO|nr:uncharacterized protein BDR25DRAFT_79857 [Lindgomyces ingoldianus]KAF2466157.1 hypothetical protein BDR25DRAFT_79857 [Lindgomyces ingoldianus]